ncbi:hypothetical protein E3N88_20726 [Mikania micrantha]|uniref:CCHC-type domain-containing protein n=1 Tax=Mikania micrantha TaxID=192012 RepID=A0A5N6NJP1_9ASTR|nr:hypothetical protein E3N88_20726 [Mikania micrantha]
MIYIITRTSISNAYPIFAQQGYENPREAIGRIVCANCHLANKPVDIEVPHLLLQLKGPISNRPRSNFGSFPYSLVLLAERKSGICVKYTAILHTAPAARCNSLLLGWLAPWSFESIPPLFGDFHFQPDSPDLEEKHMYPSSTGFEKTWVNDNKKPVGPSFVNLVEEDGSSKNNHKLKGKRKFQGKDNKDSNKKQIITCWKCGKVGHFKKDCRVGKHNKEAGPSGSKDPNKQQGHNLAQNYNSVVNYVSLISEACYVHDDDIAWWVDSGATSHVCKDLRCFKDFQPIEDGSVIKMGNIATEPIKGLGIVKLVFTSGKCLCLDNVLYVPRIRKNLLSSIMLNNCGYKQVLESDKFILSRHGTFVGFGYLCSGVFKLNLDVSFSNESVCMTSTSSRSNLNKSEL